MVGASNEKDRVALPVLVPTLTITDTALDGSATCNLQDSDVGETQSVMMQGVNPICALEDISFDPPKLTPSKVMLESPDGAAFAARTALTTGASKLKSLSPVARTFLNTEGVNGLL